MVAYLLALESSPGLEAVGEHLPQRHAVGPDIRGWGEFQVADAFRGTPANYMEYCIIMWEGLSRAYIFAAIDNMQYGYSLSLESNNFNKIQNLVN